MQPLSYFDLVVATVRGMTPVPEYRMVVPETAVSAKKHLKDLKHDFKHSSPFSWVMHRLLLLFPGILNKAWRKMGPTALTMCGEKSIHQLVAALDTVHQEKIDGDFIEAGVWRGGLPIIMRAHLHAVGDKDRTVWLADSFQGLPHVSENPKDQFAQALLKPLGYLKIQRDDVEAAFNFFGLLDSQVKIVEGWFSDTLSTLPAKSFSLIRLDGDYYESTRDAITALYPKLSPGGFLIVDDYNLPVGCKKAIDEYRELNSIHAPIVKINKQAIYWRKEKS